MSAEETHGGGLLLAIDTATRSSVVVIGGADVLAVSQREVQHRHGSHVLDQVDTVLRQTDVGLDDISAVAVGTGPGSFTGLRVGLATAKTIAYARHLPLVGVMSSDALRRAAVDAGSAPEDIAVVLPAGARDHYLARAGVDPVLIPPGDLERALSGGPALSIDTTGDPLGAEAEQRGATALAGLPRALLAIARERVASGPPDDVAELVPAYVALPRGVSHAAEELGWSPDLR